MYSGHAYEACRLGSNPMHTLAEDLLASQEGLCSMVLVSKTDMWLASATRIPGPFSFLGPYIHTDMLHTL